MSQRTAANNAEYKLLYNKELSFHERLWTKYNVTVRMIRLKAELKKVAQQPGVYLPDQVADDCKDAVIKLADITKAHRMRYVKAMITFPTVAQLNSLDKKCAQTTTARIRRR